MMEIVQLNIFPIKGCRGIGCDEIEVDAIGPMYDRRLMLVDSEGRFVSQREIPRLATLALAVRDGLVTVTAASGEQLVHRISTTGPTRVVRVWRADPIDAVDQGDAAAEWFSSRLDAPLRLVGFGPRTRNSIDPRFAPRSEAQTSFTDGYPIMAILQESFDALNRELPVAVPIERFRPSVVVRGAPAWSEDEWRVARLGELVCDVVKPCARCVVTTTDQQTGARDPGQEPLRTLTRLRNRPPFGAIFGQNLVPRTSGKLRLGDRVDLV